VRRREFIRLLGGAAAWPLAVRAQQQERVRRVGVLMGGLAAEEENRLHVAAFVEGLQQLGWTDGHNLQFDIRWAGGWGADSSEAIRKHAAELVALAPDVILAQSSPVTAALQQLTRSVPIVFATVIDGSCSR
jgi:putative tryptophan/tyrosine transport system substrate-binding protein